MNKKLIDIVLVTLTNVIYENLNNLINHNDIILELIHNDFDKITNKVKIIDKKINKILIKKNDFNINIINE